MKVNQEERTASVFASVESLNTSSTLAVDERKAPLVKLSIDLSYTLESELQLTSSVNRAGS